MINPISVHFDHRRKTSWLYFDDHDPMECSMRGSICWPIPYESNGMTDTNGYALMAGQDIKTNIIYVFEQKEWVTIDNILKSDGTIRYIGLSHWFNTVWVKYFGQKFYYHQSIELSRRFRLQITRSKMINPNPRFHELPPTDPQDIIATIWRVIKEGRLKRARDTILESQLKSVKTGDKQILPAVYALGCLLVGFERYPWRKPYDKPIEEVLIR